MSYADQDNFFAQAYRTGTDRWTNIPFTRRAHELAIYLPKGSIVLDIGAGRGRLMTELQTLGLRAIGLEKNPELVARGNEEIKNKNLGQDLRFLEGDALNMPLADASFDAAIDVGLLQHLKPEHFAEYVAEVMRVLKHGGLFVAVVLSKETEKYFTWLPKDSANPDYELDGVHYHFFTDEEIKSLLGDKGAIRFIHHDAPFGTHDTIYSVVLMKKK